MFLPRKTANVKRSQSADMKLKASAKVYTIAEGYGTFKGGAQRWDSIQTSLRKNVVVCHLSYCVKTNVWTGIQTSFED